MAVLLLICSPGHIPFVDSRWQDLLQGYEVWVHMEETEATEGGTILSNACQSMAKHAAVSSNLAALSLHVTRMLCDLAKDIQQTEKASSTQDQKASTTAFSRRIARVGKARATAGALQLLRLLIHPVVANCVSTDRHSHSEMSPLEQALQYHTRGDIPNDQSAGLPLVNSILDLVVVSGRESCDALQTPEIYDTVVISLQLLLVLCGTQLYQPFQSSFQRTEEHFYENYILDIILRDTSGDEAFESNNYAHFSASSRSNNLSFSGRSNNSSHRKRRRHHVWTPRSILESYLRWQIHRPPAPEKSISHYYFVTAQAAVAARGGDTLGRDGMYETYGVVHAVAPQGNGGKMGTVEISADNAVGGTSNRRIYHKNPKQNMILDATKGAFVIGGKIIMLPFRLMALVLGTIRSNKSSKSVGYDEHFQQKLKSLKSSRTRDVLWLSESILTDLMTCLVLLLVNNKRHGVNLFRKELSEVTDESWENESGLDRELPDLPNSEARVDGDDVSISFRTTNEEESLKDTHSVGGNVHLSVKFDALFDAFGRTLHSEVGALMLYTVHHACPRFAESMIVRSELDKLVLPLLRTFYFSSNTHTYVANDFASKGTVSNIQKLEVRNCPFRAMTQLYVIVILLLLFSQDTIFGRDIFRRIRISQVPWYKERNLRDINLGSVVLLTILRSLMFNLQRLNDPFLLSNCCAILQNLSTSIVDIHDYAAMRVASVTAIIIKKHAKLHSTSTTQRKTEQKSDVEGFLSSPVTMHEEVARTLLETIYHCLSPKTIERNLHLVYALVYHQADLNRVFNQEALYPSKLIQRIQSVTSEASKIIQEEGARDASKSLIILEDRIEELQKFSERTGRKKESDDIMFTYEEESDPEIFFVPYVWETTVCVATASIIEWKKDQICVFSLLDPISEVSSEADGVVKPPKGEFSKDIVDVV